jgi:hypothetical protein
MVMNLTPALLSYWFLIARRTFEGVLRQDPTCAIAYWGIALDLLNNSLAVVPPRADAEAAWAALEKAREIGAKTQAQWRAAQMVEVERRVAELARSSSMMLH